MKSSVVIPIVLIVCLLALALLISQAFTAAKQAEVVPEDSGSYTISPNEVQDSFRFPDDRSDLSTSGELVPRELTPVTSAPSSSDAPARTVGLGGTDEAYFVIAGTFRQEINARTRVRDLRRAGFSDTQLSRFDRGTYAVALVGRSTDFTEADQLAERVRTAGFEAKVYRKR